MKIIKARINLAEVTFPTCPSVFVVYDENPNKEEWLFDYFPDEISFRSEEFIGLTYDQAIHLKFIKDKQYLQS